MCQIPYYIPRQGILYVFLYAEIYTCAQYTDGVIPPGGRALNWIHLNSMHPPTEVGEYIDKSIMSMTTTVYVDITKTLHCDL